MIRDSSGSERFVLALLLVILVSGCVPGGNSTTVFEGARVIIGDGATVIEDGAIVVRDGTIVEVGARACLLYTSDAADE